MKKLILAVVLMQLFVQTAKATSLILSRVPKEIEAKSSFEVWVDFLTSSKNATYYLAGVFYKSSGSNLFGLTEVTADKFVSLSASPSSFFEIKTDEVGSFSGTLKVKADIEDKGFSGEGDYYLRVDRYTGKSANPAESSNELIIKLLYAVPPSPSPLPSPKPTSTPQTTPEIITVYVTPVPTAIPTKPPKTKVAPASTILGIMEVNMVELATDEVSISAATNVAESDKSVNNKITPWMILMGSLLVAGGLIPASLKWLPQVE